MKYLLLLLLALISQGSLEAKLEDHLRKIEGKNPSLHKMRNIDFIYLINLDVRPEKLNRSLNQLRPYGITPCRFSAVNGWELSLDVINDVGLKYTSGMEEGLIGTSYLTEDHQPTHGPIQTVGQTYFLHQLPLGAIGICLSHLSILQDAWDSGYETIWIMEDDIDVIRNPRTISTLIERLDRRVGKGNWDILFTDQDFRNSEGEYVPCWGYAKRPNFTPAHPERFALKEQIDHEFRKVGSRFGAHSMIMRRSGIEKVLNFIKTYEIFLPLDMDNYLVEDIQLYTVLDDIVGNLPGALSDNRTPSFRKPH